MVSGLGEEVHKLWVEVGGKGEIAATVTSHYYIGEDMVGHALRQFMDKHPPWVSMAAWDCRLQILFIVRGFENE